MGSGYKKKEGVNMGNYTATDREIDAYVWCVRNDIKITPSAKSSTEWYLDIIINGRISRSPSTYKKMEIWKQLYKFYLYYYNKHHKQEDVIGIKKLLIEKPAIKLNKQKELF
tara:strand:+ start:7172 stop:7507 length:336 start_codon:yes stop_codon:yes gene_type:complete